MGDETKTALARYIAHESGSVQGWFARVDAEIYRAILLGQSEQNLSGSAIEIGIHHGRSFVALCLALRSDEKAYCIDIFDDQNLNKDFLRQGGSVDLREQSGEVRDRSREGRDRPPLFAACQTGRDC